MTKEFERASAKVAEAISRSKTEEDPVHSLKTRDWLLRLKPDADETLQLAALGHDIERAMPDRLRRDNFIDYDSFKSAHAKRAGEIMRQIIVESGYNEIEAARIARIIEKAELESNDPESNLLMDADSISFFDYNIDFYLKRKGEEETKKKAEFMFDRASEKAKKLIQGIAIKKPIISALLTF